MRSSHLAFAAALLLAPALAQPKPWQGINPGASTADGVLGRFGEPTTKRKVGNRTQLVFMGEQAIAGTKQTQFLVSEEGTVLEIVVFPTTQLDKDSIEGTYGKPPQKTFTDDFRPAWAYRALGVLVFFGKEGFVEAIQFRAGEGQHASPPAAKPAPAAHPAPRGQAEAAASAKGPPKQ